MSDGKPGTPGPIDFYTFVHLGEAPHPETGAPLEPDLVLAQQTIDILAMLREKTKGNLTPEEEKFLDALLTDLRMRFVERSAASGHR